MEDREENFSAYSVQDLIVMTSEAERLNEGHRLREYLKNTGFRQDAPNLFSRGKPEQFIELTTDENRTTYVNLLDKNDSGSFIQFLQNRLLSKHYIIPNDELYTYLSAIKLALACEKVNEKQAISQPKKTNKKARRRRGL